MAVDARAALAKLTSGQTLTAEEKATLNIGAGTPVTKTAATMTQAEKDAATAATIAAGGSSTDPANRLAGETASQANARITAGYKDMLAKPVLSQAATDAGATVEYVRTAAGGVGSYTVVTPVGYTGPKITTTEWTAGIIPSNSPYTTGTTLGVMSNGQGGYTQVGGVTPTTVTKSTTSTTATNKTVVNRVKNTDGSYTVTYSDGTTTNEPGMLTSNTNVNTNNNTSGVTPLDVNPTLAITKAYMVNMGYPADLIDSSSEFIKALLIDGMSPTNAVDILTTAKSYTTKSGKSIDSPFYSAYGIYNEGLKIPKTASELFNAVEGYKATAAKYNLDTKFTSPDMIKNLVKNNWTVADFDNAANTARLMAVTSDPFKVAAMRKMGYINQSQDLTDFYMNASIGKEKMQQNIATAAYGAEMLRRITPENLLTFNQDFINKAGAMSAGLSEAEATAAAVKGAQNIADTLAPTYGLSGIYERGANLSASQIQSELEQEQLTGMASERRKRLAQQNVAAFSAAPGTGRYSTSQAGAAGLV